MKFVSLSQVISAVRESCLQEGSDGFNEVVNSFNDIEVLELREETQFIEAFYPR